MYNYNREGNFMDNKDEDFTDKKKIALNRADELKNRIRDY